MFDIVLRIHGNQRIRIFFVFKEALWFLWMRQQNDKDKPVWQSFFEVVVIRWYFLAIDSTKFIIFMSYKHIFSIVPNQYVTYILKNSSAKKHRLNMLEPASWLSFVRIRLSTQCTSCSVIVGDMTRNCQFFCQCVCCVLVLTVWLASAIHDVICITPFSYRRHITAIALLFAGPGYWQRLSIAVVIFTNSVNLIVSISI